MSPAGHGGSPGYAPNRLFDRLLALLKLKNDAALSRLLEVEPPTISKTRHGRMRLGAGLLPRPHEVSEPGIQALLELMGDRRGHTRLSD